jgi:hypothetical protein
MAWNKKRRIHKGVNSDYSLVRKLRKDKRSNYEFEIMLNNLTLEEVIALKLELAAQAAGGALYGLPLWHSLKDIVQDAVLKYTFSATRTKGEAMRFLGLTPSHFYKLQEKFKIEEYFSEKVLDNNPRRGYINTRNKGGDTDSTG